jgi:hypothetical protein
MIHASQPSVENVGSPFEVSTNSKMRLQKHSPLSLLSMINSAINSNTNFQAVMAAPRFRRIATAFFRPLRIMRVKMVLHITSSWFVRPKLVPSRSKAAEGPALPPFLASRLLTTVSRLLTYSSSARLKALFGV